MTKSCKVDKVTGLFEKGCEFLPDREQTEKASIMFSPSVNSVSIFFSSQHYESMRFLSQMLQERIKF